MSHNLLKTKFLLLEVYAATGLFPVPVSSRIGALATTDFFRFFGLRFLFDVVFFGMLSGHGGSMPDTGLRCQSSLIQRFT
jgi:hypothetical protein